MLAIERVSFSYSARLKRGPTERGATERGARLQPGQRVLHDVSLSAGPGDLVGILGPNGSGKTTLLRIAAGLLRPVAGSVALDGVPLARVPRAAIARRIAVVPQETHPAFDYTVLEMVLMGRYPHLGAFALESPEDLAVARRALAATGTAQLAERPFTTLSGGEKQRVVIASALAQLEAGPAEAGPHAGLLLLDEPTASLDLGYQLEVAQLVRRLHAERGIGVMVSTHDLNFAASLCRRLVVLKAGEVIAAGPTADVLTPALIRRLYGVEAEIAPHPRTGQLVVVPIGREASP